MNFYWKIQPAAVILTMMTMFVPLAEGVPISICRNLHGSSDCIVLESSCKKQPLRTLDLRAHICYTKMKQNDCGSFRAELLRPLVQAKGQRFDPSCNGFTLNTDNAAVASCIGETSKRAEALFQAWSMAQRRCAGVK